jgi:hypothetical protein
MDYRIRITAGDVGMEAELNDSKISRAIWNALPIEQVGLTWGDEIYFSIPVQAEAENAREVVQLGDLGYWPPGTAFCIFFGPTPASQGDEIRPASAVEVVGHLLGEPTDFKRVRSGTVVSIEKMDN